MPEHLQDGEPTFNKELSKSELLDWVFECRSDSQAFFEGKGKPWGEAAYFANVNASESYSKEESAELKRTGRPNIDPPFAAGVIEAVVGAEIAQEVEPVFQGVDQGFEDQVIADWLTQLVRNGFNLVGARDRMLEAFSDKCTSGYGFVQFYLDLHQIPWRIACKKLNFWNVWPDPEAVEANLRDARWWIVETEWDLEDAEANWSSPEQKAALRGAVTGRKGSSGILPRTPAKGGGRTRRKNGVTILEFQYRRALERAHYPDPETQEEVDSTREEYEARKREINDAADAQMAEFEEKAATYEAMAATGDPMVMAGAQPPQPPQPVRMDEEYEARYVVFYNGYTYRRAFICGDSSDTGAVLEDKEIDLELPGGEPGFTIKCDTGYGWQLADEERVRRFGLMRKIVHIQEWFTKSMQDYLELMGRKIKGGGLAETGAFENVKGGFREFVKNSSKGGMWHEVADGAISGGKIQPFQPASGEPGILEIVNVMKELFAWVTGVSQALQGTMSSDRSNVLTENMQAQGLQMLLPIRQPRKEFLLSCGRLWAAIALKHLPAEELDRILGLQQVPGMTVREAVDPMTGKPKIGPNGKPVMEPILGPDGQPMTAGKILKQADLLDYDLTADVSAVNQSEKMRFVQVWNQHGLGQILSEALPGPKGARIWVPRLLQNLPLPASQAKAMAADSEKLLEEMATAETEQGILSAFEAMLQSNPEGASSLHEQLMGMLQQAGIPEGGQPVQ